MKFMALGSNIFISTNPHCGQTPTLIYDTNTALLSISPRLPASLLPGLLHIAVAAGDTLYGSCLCTQSRWGSTRSRR
jgi:hypothetical protein